MSVPPLVSTVKGLALASSFITLGSLYTLSSATIPGILHTLADDSTSAAQSAAQQFAIAQRAGRVSTLPTEILSILGFGFLSYNSYQNGSSIILGGPGGFRKWKLYAAAAASMFTVIPITITLMSTIETKLLALADAPAHKPSTQPELEHTTSSNTLSIPGQSSHVRPPITPIEEFEPYEDSPFSTDEYEREKVKKMLLAWDGRNMYRRMGVCLAGIFGLWAMLE
jgi:hypothetical protein